MIRRDTIRRFLIAALLAICAVLLVLVLYYENLPTSVEVIEDVVMDADVELKTFNYTETVDGVTHWTLTGDNGYTLLTERASYYGNRSQSGVIESPVAVIIRSDQLELHGTGLVLDIGLRTMRLNKDVTATFYPEAQKEQP